MRAATSDLPRVPAGAFVRRKLPGDNYAWRGVTGLETAEWTFMCQAHRAWARLVAETDDPREKGLYLEAIAELDPGFGVVKDGVGGYEALVRDGELGKTG